MCCWYSFFDGAYHDSLLTSGTIRNCKFQGTVSASGTRFAHAGGITAEIGNGRIDNCEVLSGSKISSSTEERRSFAGGIAGDVGPHIFEDEAANGEVYITNCTSYAEISGNGENGGIAGHGSTSKSDRIHFYGNTWPSEYPEIGNKPSSNDEPAASGLPTATIQHVELSQDVFEKAASAVNIDVSQLLTLSFDSISVPKEPTQAMSDYAKNDNTELTGKLNTLEVNREGYYVFKVTLSNELWEKIKNQNISDYKFYGLYDSDAKVSSSFINGLLGTWKILTMKGEKMTSFGVREFLMVAFLNAGTPFTMFLAKLIMSILGGGCTTGISIAGLALIACAVFFRKH